MQTHEYLDRNGWRFEWINGVLQIDGVSDDRLKDLGARKPVNVRLSRVKHGK